MNSYDPKDRAKEKALSREADAKALESGDLTQEELRAKNGKFAFPNAKILWDKIKRLY